MKEEISLKEKEKVDKEPFIKLSLIDVSKYSFLCSFIAMCACVCEWPPFFGRKSAYGGIRMSKEIRNSIDNV